MRICRNTKRLKNFDASLADAALTSGKVNPRRPLFPLLAQSPKQWSIGRIIAIDHLPCCGHKQILKTRLFLALFLVRLTNVWDAGAGR